MPYVNASAGRAKVRLATDMADATSAAVVPRDIARFLNVIIPISFSA